MTKQLVRHSIAVMVTLFGLAILWQFRTVVVYVLLSVTLAAALRPLVTRLVGKRLVEQVLWVMVYLASLAVAGYLLYLFGRAAVLEIQELANAVAEQEKWTLPAWLEGSLFQEMLSARLLSPNRLFQAATYGQAQLVLPALVGFTQGIASLFSGIFVVFILSLYWIVSKSHFERLWLSLLPSGVRKQARQFWQTIEPEMGKFIRNQVFTNLIAGVLLGMGYYLIGSPYPTLLAIIGAFLAAIPYAGVVLAAIIPFLVGVLAGGELTLFMVLYTLLVVIGISIWVKPRLYDRRWDNPILTLLLLVALADAFGLIGIIIAPPLATVIQIFWSLSVTNRTAMVETSQVSNFKLRHEKVLETIRSMEEPPPPQVTNTMERLGRLIEKSEPILQQNRQAETPSGATRLPGSNRR